MIKTKPGENWQSLFHNKSWQISGQEKVKSFNRVCQVNSPSAGDTALGLDWFNQDFFIRRFHSLTCAPIKKILLFRIFLVLSKFLFFLLFLSVCEPTVKPGSNIGFYFASLPPQKILLAKIQRETGKNDGNIGKE